MVGGIDDRDVSDICRKASRRTGREVMPVHYSAEGLARRAQEDGGFVNRVLNDHLTFVRGDADVLRRLAEGSVDQVLQPDVA